MKKSYLFAFTTLTLALALTACGTASTPTVIPTVNLNIQPITSTSNSVSASGQVVPVQKVQLSFPLIGTAKTVEVKAGDNVTAGQTLVTLDTTLLEAKVKEAQANVAAAQTQVDLLRRMGTSQENLDGAQAEVDKAQALLDSANATLAQATLTAPFNGTVAEVDLSPAETVVPGQIVIVIGDLTKFQIETTDLSERDAPNVKVGQSATVSIAALNQKLTGKVSDVARISTTVGGDVVYKVTLQLDTQPQGLMWGMTTDVTIQTGN
jgi:RND family efflux transporter MFP subunit